VDLFEELEQPPAGRRTSPMSNGSRSSAVVDMSPAGVTARLREMAALLAARGFIAKGVDMSREAVTGRLQAMGALSDMCRKLAAVGKRLRPLGGR
jgi:hypothetical protein